MKARRWTLSPRQNTAYLSKRSRQANETGVVYSIFTPDASTISAWIEEKGKADGDPVIKNGTIAELCEKTGIDRATPTARTDRWNAKREADLNEDCGQTDFKKP